MSTGPDDLNPIAKEVITVASGVALDCLLCPRLLQPGLTALNSRYKLRPHLHPPRLQKVLELIEHPFTVSAQR